MNRWIVFLIIGLLPACSRSPEEQARLDEHKREECLNMICTGDIPPKHDMAREVLFKRNGRWFVALREYGGFDGGLAFFWPSKTPANKPGAARDAPEFTPSAPGRISNGSAVTIEIFIQSGPPKGEMYPSVLEDLQLRDYLKNRKTLRPGLERITSKSDATGYWQYYLAKDVTTPAGVPALLSCRIAGDSFCTMGFDWKSLNVYVRFDQQHAQDWPEVFTELLRVINLTKEIDPRNGI